MTCTLVTAEETPFFTRPDLAPEVRLHDPTGEPFSLAVADAGARRAPGLGAALSRNPARG